MRVRRLVRKDGREAAFVVGSLFMVSCVILEREEETVHVV